MNKVYCDKCNRGFEIRLKIQKINDDIERAYFVCPKCKTEYEGFFYINDRIKALQRRVRDLQDEYEELRGRQLRKNYNRLREIMELQNSIGKEMDILKKLYG